MFIEKDRAVIYTSFTKLESVIGSIKKTLKKKLVMYISPVCRKMVEYDGSTIRITSKCIVSNGISPTRTLTADT